MNGFSFRRMFLFCRLQLCETYGGGILKNLGICLLTALGIVILAMGINGWVPEESIQSTEIVSVVAVLMQGGILTATLLNERMMVPASILEKFVAVFAGTLLVGIIFLAVMTVIGSAIFTLLAGQDGERPLIIFFREGFNVKIYLISSIVFIILTNLQMLQRKRYIILLIALASIVAIIFLLDWINLGKGFNTAVFTIILICSIIWSYRLLKEYEMTTDGNDLFQA